MRMRPFAFCLLGALALTGCAAGTVTPPLPTSPDGCQAEFDATKGGRIRSTPPTYVSGNNAGGASLIGTAIGRGGIAKGAAESRYTACMAQFGTGGAAQGTTANAPPYTPTAASTDAPAPPAQPTAPPRPPRRATRCNGSVFVGGDGYCIQGGR